MATITHGIVIVRNCDLEQLPLDGTQGLPTPWPPAAQVGTHLAEIFSTLPMTTIRAYLEVRKGGIHEWRQTTKIYDCTGIKSPWMKCSGLGLTSSPKSALREFQSKW